MAVEKTMDKIVALCKSRGFIFPGSEIYGGLANSWDYGPLGVEFKDNVKRLLIKHNPNILVITGHDAHYQKRKNNESYKNSKYFIETVIEARKYKNNHKDLVIIAGACQSDYEGLIKVQATFASSPKIINIHALDPAIIAASIALTDKTEVIDIQKILAKTKYGSEGMGGIIINGMMNTGYPRKDIN